MSDRERLEQLEQQIRQCNSDEQLWLIERLASGLRKHAAPVAHDAELAAMAADPEIQHELRQIERDFSDTEHDGLDKY